MSFGFVILNYNTYCETVELIKTIDRIFKGEENKIVIVDNASQDHSLEKFKLLYEDNNNVCILQMPYNMGFSKANNEGYKYLRPMNLDFIFICNSDIEFQQKNFKNELLELYKSIKFDVCGPDVWAPNMKRKILSWTSKSSISMGIFSMVYTVYYTKSFYKKYRNEV